MQSVQHVCTLWSCGYGMSLQHSPRVARGRYNHWTYHKRLNNNFTLPVPNPMER